MPDNSKAKASDSHISSFSMGGLAMCLLLMVVVLTFGIVIARYIFNASWVWLQELVLAFHAVGFLVGVGLTWRREAHVQVDIFSQKFGFKATRWVQVFGINCLLFPMLAVIFYQAWPFVVDSWEVRESSVDGAGLSGIYLIKSTILFFPIILVYHASIRLRRIFKELRWGQQRPRCQVWMAGEERDD